MAGSVSQADLAHRPLLRPAEILEAVPGLLITQHSGDGKANQYFSRGFNLDHGTDFAFFVDGVPINLPSHAHGQGYSDLNFLIPELVEEINYTKGPYNVEAGDFATAGSADFEYPHVLPRDLAKITVGEFGYIRGVAASSSLLGPGHLLFALEGEGYDGPWVTPEDNKKYNGMLRYSLGNDDSRWDLSASGMEASWNATNQTPARAVNDGEINWFGSLDPTDGGDSKRASAWASWTGREGDDETRVLAYTVYSHLHLWNDFTFYALGDGSPDTLTGGPTDQFEQEDERVESGARARQKFSFDLGGFKTLNEAGLDWRDDNIPTLGLYQTSDRIVTSITQINHVVESSGAPYFQNTIVWTPWMRTVLGYRQDFFHIQVLGDTPDTQGETCATMPEPKAALILRPFEGPLEFYLNFGQGFHSNDGRNITPDALNQAGQSSVGSELLARADGEEAGTRLGLGDLYEGTLSVWRLDMSSELTFDGDAAASAVNGASTREGVELSNTFRWKPFYADLDYSWSQARFNQIDTVDDPAHPGYWVPEAIENQGSATLGVGPLSGWSLDARMRYFGSRALVPDDSVRSDPSELLSLRLSRALTKDESVHLDVFNVLDQKTYDVSYYYASQLKGESAPAEDVVGHPAEPRSVRVTWEDKF